MNSLLDEAQKKLIQDCIIKVLMDDSRTMPFSVLRAKTYRTIKFKQPNIFIKDEEFAEIVEHMMSIHLIGRTQYNKYFVDYLDYQKGSVTGEGYLEIDKRRGNGFITIKKDASEYKKSSHFVHKKNLNGAEDGDYVKFVELIVNNKKHFSKFSLIDAAVLEVIDTEKK